MSRFIEIQNLGWNVETFTFLMVLFFGVYGARGLKKQIQKLREVGTESVSVITNLCYLAMFATFLPFGLEMDQLAQCTQFALRVPFCLVIVVILYKENGGFSLKEKVVATALVAALLYMFVDVGSVYVAILWVGVVLAADQPWQMLRSKKAGGVSVEAYWAFWWAVVFWLVYGIVMEDAYTVSWSVPYILVYSATIYLYYKYND